MADVKRFVCLGDGCGATLGLVVDGDVLMTPNFILRESAVLICTRCGGRRRWVPRSVMERQTATAPPGRGKRAETASLTE